MHAWSWPRVTQEVDFITRDKDAKSMVHCTKSRKPPKMARVKAWFKFLRFHKCSRGWKSGGSWREKEDAIAEELIRASEEVVNDHNNGDTN
ncbi:hypothetical protein NC651_033363 [Populus alba x Populus x berolinensis]|nr:hypothetical protein NC651_033363 [Populus alba x Populus x berolinensis]